MKRGSFSAILVSIIQLIVCLGGSQAESSCADIFLRASKTPKVVKAFRASDYYDPVPLNSVAEKTAFLMYLSRLIPDFYESAGLYSLDLFQVLERQKRIRKRLSQLPEYQSLVGDRYGLIDFEITVKKNHEENVFVLSSSAVQEVQSEFVSLLSELGSSPRNLLDALAEYIQMGLRDLQNRNSRGFVTGLINSLPAELRADVFREGDFNTKVQLLKERLRDEGIENRFRWNQWGFDRAPSVNEAFEKLAELRAPEQRLRVAVQLGLILQRKPGEWVPLDEIEQFVESITNDENLADASVILGNRREMNDRLEGFEDVLGVSKTRDRVLLSDLIQSYSKDKLEKIKALRPQNVDTISIKEVPPDIGIFRGIAGRECSTSYSYAYPNSPMERVFFIYDAKGKLRGYLQGTHVFHNGKKAFYLHSINGPNISRSAAQNIIFAMYGNRSRFGVEEIILPTEKQADGLINGHDLINAVTDLSKRGELVSISHPDEDIRGVLSNTAGSAGLYDTTKKNRRGHLFEPSSTDWDPALIEARFSKGENLVIPEASFRKEDLVLLSLDLGRLGQWESAKRVADLLSIELKQIRKLHRTLENLKKQNISDYYEEVYSLMSALGVENPGDLVESRPYYVGSGHLRSRDAFSRRNIDQTVRLLIDYMKTVDPPTLAISIAKDHAEVLASNRNFQRFVNSLGMGNLNGIFILEFVAASDIPIASLTISRLKQLLRMMDETEFLDNILDIFKKMLFSQYALSDRFKKRTINRLGYLLRNEKSFSMALSFVKRNADLLLQEPQFLDVLDSLSEELSAKIRSTISSQ